MAWLCNKVCTKRRSAAVPNFGSDCSEADMHGRDLLYSRGPWFGVSAMRRREFITMIGSMAAGWACAAHAQEPVIGFLSSRSPGDSVRVVAAFRQGLAEMGYVQGRNIAVEFRWAEGRLDQLPALASELVARPVAIIAALAESGFAAKAATTTIPIVFGSGGDPVEMGLVTSINRPGGNVTGATFLTAQLGAKRLGLLRDLVPGADAVALLVNPNTPVGRVQTRDVEQAARALGQNLLVLNGGSDESIEASFATLAGKGVTALLVGADTFFDTRRTD